MEHNSVLPLGIILTCGAAVAAIVGLQMLCGFVIGVITTLVAAAVASASLD